MQRRLEPELRSFLRLKFLRRDDAPGLDHGLMVGTEELGQVVHRRDFGHANPSCLSQDLHHDIVERAAKRINVSTTTKMDPIGQENCPDPTDRIKLQ